MSSFIQSYWFPESTEYNEPEVVFLVFVKLPTTDTYGNYQLAMDLFQRKKLRF